MEAAGTYQPLNDIQLHLLKMFSFTKREEGLQELQSVLFEYYRNKVKTQTNEFWLTNNLNAAKMEKIMYGHNRISGK